MNIILNTQTLQSTLTGIGWYTRNLLQGLQKHKIINQLICIPSLKESNQIIKKIIFQTNLKKIIKFFPGTYSLLSRYRSTQFIKKNSFFSS